MAAAVHADKLLVGSFLNAKATARYIVAQKPPEVSLVCMGWKERTTEEDTLCAAYLQALLKGEPFDHLEEKCRELRFTEGKKFFEPDRQDVFPKEDFSICTKPNRYTFAIVSKRHADLFRNKRVNVYA